MQSQAPSPAPQVEVVEFEAWPTDAVAASGVPDAPPLARIVALSDDPNLLDALYGAAQAQALIVSPTADRFIDQLVANAASIALIDAASAPVPLKAFIALLHEQFPQLLLILAGAAPVHAQLAEPIAAGTIFRFVHKPVSGQRLKFFIDAALSARTPGEPPGATPAPKGLESAERPRLGLSAMPGVGLGLTVLAAVLTAAAIAWSLSHHALALAP
jgi:hypothetical protein